MGFGLLFLGYFAMTLMSINPVGSFAQIIGYALMLIASVKLNKYDVRFKWLSVSSGFMIAVSCAISAAEISSFLYEQMIIDTQPLGDTYQSIFVYLQLLGIFALHTALLFAIRSISTETGVLKNAMLAVRNYVFVCIYCVLWLLAMTVKAISSYCLVAATIAYFAFVITNLVLIFSCYARICDESDVDMEQKPSRFAFVNKMREQSAQRQADAAARRAEYKSKRKSK